jgi:hypothetical protein
MGIAYQSRKNSGQAGGLSVYILFTGMDASKREDTGRNERRAGSGCYLEREYVDRHGLHHRPQNRYRQREAVR